VIRSARPAAIDEVAVSDQPDDSPSSLFEELFAAITKEQQELLLKEFSSELEAPAKRFAEDIRTAFDFSRAWAGDEVATSALRILQAVGVAVRRKDALTLGGWEKATLRYMQKHALDEYVGLPMPSRPKHDRHLVLAAVRSRIAKFLREHRPTAARDSAWETMAHQVTASMKLRAIVQMAFPQLSVNEPAGAKMKLLDDRIEEQLRAGRSLTALDPEEILLDVLEGLGVPRPTGWNWLKGAK
jgi:hypothetical protein